MPPRKKTTTKKVHDDGPVWERRNGKWVEIDLATNEPVVSEVQEEKAASNASSSTEPVPVAPLEPERRQQLADEVTQQEAERQAEEEPAAAGPSNEERQTTAAAPPAATVEVIEPGLTLKTAHRTAKNAARVVLYVRELWKLREDKGVPDIDGALADADQFAEDAGPELLEWEAPRAMRRVRLIAGLVASTLGLIGRMQRRARLNEKEVPGQVVQRAS